MVRQGDEGHILFKQDIADLANLTYSLGFRSITSTFASQVTRSSGIFSGPTHTVLLCMVHQRIDQVLGQAGHVKACRRLRRVHLDLVTHLELSPGGAAMQGSECKGRTRVDVKARVDVRG